MSVIVQGKGYAMDGDKIVSLVEEQADRTVEVKVTEVLERIIVVELPLNAKDSDAIEIVGELYERQDFYLDGDDLSGDAEIELA
jgi:hypothetical protein